MGDDVLLAFDGYCLDVAQGSIRDRQGRELELRPKSFDLLHYFVRNAGRLLPRNELMDVVWPGVFVSDDSLTQCVAEIRRALKEDGDRLLRTLPKRGYIFSAESSGVSARDSSASAPPELRRDPANDATTSVGGKSSFKIFENVPPQLPSFVGREAALSDLHRLLTTGEQRAATAQVAIHGLGGMGKTSLVAEYAHRYANEYAGVWWARAENRTVLVGSLAGLNVHLQPNMPEEADQERAARAALRLIARSSKPFLLVYDDIENPDLLAGLVPSAGARLLLTTRWADWGGGSAELALDVLGSDASVQFLQKRSGRQDSEGAVGLAEALGNLPLALDHAGAYCRLTGIRFEEYRHKIDDLVARAPKGATYPSSVRATFDLAIKKAAAECAAAETLLGSCAFLAPDRVPLDLVFGDIPDGGDREEALLNLAAVSLIEHTTLDGSGGPALKVHRLVQSAMRRRLAAEGKIEETSARVLRQLANSFPATAYRDTSVWPWCADLLPHVIAMRDPMQHVPRTGGFTAFFHAAGSYLHRRGSYADAEPLLTQAISSAEQTVGADHADVAEARASLARLYRDAGRYAEAEPLLRAALASTRHSRGAEHPKIATRLNELALLLYNTGRHAEAEPLYREAIAVGKPSLGRDHSTVAIALGSLARLYRAAGRHSEAEPLFKEAIAAGRKALAREHPVVSAALARQSAPRRKPSAKRDGSTDHEPAGVGGGREANYEHPDVAIQLNNLAYLYRSIGRYADAEPLLKEALAISERALGKEHPDTAISLSGLARLYRAMGRYRDAEPLLKQAIAISEKLVGREHPTVAIWLYNLARLYQDAGRYPDAEEVLTEVIRISRKTLGEANQGTGRAQWALANIFMATGRHEEALKEGGAARAIHERVLGPNHQWTVDSRQTYASALSALGRSAEAALRGREHAR